MNKPLLEVRAIENGTVIDHIPSGSLFEVIKILKINTLPNQITFGTNLDSKLLGNKAIIKLSDYYCCDEDIDRISIVAPTAKINIIKNYEVVEKRRVRVPESLEGFVKCANPMCITNHQKITTKFKVVNGEDISLVCHYCEKVTDKNQIELFK